MRSVLSLLFLFLASAPAGAVILTGEVTGGQSADAGGGFVEILNTDGLSIGADTFDDHNLYAFNERQNVVSDDVIKVDVGRDILAGEVVASHYLAYDPKSSGIEAIVTFDAPIIGVATSTNVLAGSDFLMNSAIEYLNPRARGLEGKDWIQIDPNDPNTLVLSLFASSPGDFIRVFTERSVVAEDRGISETVATPVPAASLLFVSGAMALALRRRKASRS